MTVLVLNQDWQPLTVARVPRALSLIDRGKAEILESGVAPIVTPSCSLPRPSVIRLVYQVKRPRPRVRFTRQNVFRRDSYQCQYCGVRPRELTIDHVMPVSRGGRDTWDNVTSACQRCNHKKGARTPAEAGMTLRKTPFEPKISSHLHLFVIDPRPEWVPFISIT